jgi:predicted RecB family nuclease
MGATWERCRVHFMRNALAYAGKTQRRIVSAWVGTAFAQDDAAAARKQWREVADQARPRVPKLAALMDDAEADVLAYMGFPAQHRAKLHSTDEIDKLFRRELLSWSARVTAWQRAGLEDANPITLPSVSFLVCGTRAPLCTPRLPLADEPFVGLLGMTRELDLTITQRFDIVGIRGARFASFPRRLPGFQLHRA